MFTIQLVLNSETLYNMLERNIFYLTRQFYLLYQTIFFMHESLHKLILSLSKSLTRVHLVSEYL